MFDFLLLLQIADVGVIQFPFCFRQLGMIVLKFGLAHILHRVQNIFAALFSGVDSLQACVFILFLCDLLMNFGRYRSFDNALRWVLWNRHCGVFLKAQAMYDGPFAIY